MPLFQFLFSMLKCLHYWPRNRLHERCYTSKEHLFTIGHSSRPPSDNKHKRRLLAIVPRLVLLETHLMDATTETLQIEAHYLLFTIECSHHPGIHAKPTLCYTSRYQGNHTFEDDGTFPVYTVTRASFCSELHPSPHMYNSMRWFPLFTGKRSMSSAQGQGTSD